MHNFYVYVKKKKKKNATNKQTKNPKTIDYSMPETDKTRHG